MLSHSVDLCMVQVRRVETDELLRMLRILSEIFEEYGQDLQWNEIADAVQREEFSFDNLLVAEWESVPVGFGWFQIQSDGIALLCLPIVRPPGTPAFQPEVQQKLMHHILDILRDEEVWLAQVALEVVSLADQDLLEEHHFQKIADIQLMQLDLNSLEGDSRGREASAKKTEEEMEAGFTEENIFAMFSPSCEASQDRFASLIDRTYVGSKDCPAILPYRYGSQAIRSHTLVGSILPDQWRIYGQKQQIIGVTLMNELVSDELWEVVYCGLVPEARGRGLGFKMLSHALESAKLNGVKRVQLGVDLENEPAVRLYQKLGFRETGMMTIFGHLFDEQSLD